jgi:hypothetical protein
MSVGLPGTGVGAAFYLLSALWAPIRSLLRRDGRSRGLGIALIALGIIGALALATVAISAALPDAHIQVVTIDPGADSGTGFPSALLLLALLSPFGTLIVLLAGVRVAAAIMNRSTERDEREAIGDIETLGIDGVDERLEVAS